MWSRLRAGSAGLLVMLTLLPVVAQDVGASDSSVNLPSTVHAIFSLHGLVWLLISLTGAYIFSLLFTMLFARLGFPPLIARLGCWLSITLWVIFALAIYLPVILQQSVPLWLIVAAGVVVVLIGVIMYAVRPRR